MRLHLPHLDPIRFAQDMISRDDTECVVSAKFPHLPSLAMIVEAAAQSSAAFSTEDEDPMAFLVMLKDIQLHQVPNHLSLRFELRVEQQLGTISYFSFSAFEDERQIATGAFSIAIQE
jgi:hypothetical protein